MRENIIISDSGTDTAFLAVSAFAYTQIDAYFNFLHWIVGFYAENSEANISLQGKLNADAYCNGKLDGVDIIQNLKYIAKLIEF